MANITQKIEELLAPSAQTAGIEIVDVQYVKESGSWVARIFIDKDGGVTMDDCENMSRLFSSVLDEKDIIGDSYVLEISSPGIDRVLKSEKDFKRFAGRKARIQTLSPINNQRNFLGMIISSSGGNVKIDDVTKGNVEIEIADIKKANLEADI
ncbi:MAG: ribosome maturation factor RimP [Endomicrobia bacterium]|nr:ribosome maturation factor RimP [Endomicrobiia bacterium]